MSNFAIRVTIEVINEDGDVVTNKGYPASALKPGSSAVMMQTQQVFQEAEFIEAAHHNMNILHRTIRSIGEFKS